MYPTAARDALGAFWGHLPSHLAVGRLETRLRWRDPVTTHATAGLRSRPMPQEADADAESVPQSRRAVSHARRPSSVRAHRPLRLLDAVTRVRAKAGARD